MSLLFVQPLAEVVASQHAANQTAEEEGGRFGDGDDSEICAVQRPERASTVVKGPIVNVVNTGFEVIYSQPDSSSGVLPIV